MTQTDVANLALTKIGQSLIDDIGDTGDKNARKALLHYDPALREVLRAHFWGFAMVSAELFPLPPRILVAGAGQSVVNGYYFQFGTVATKPAYSKTGTDSIPKIIWNISGDGQWLLGTSSDSDLYQGQPGDTPDLATAWTVSGDGLPAPTVTLATNDPQLAGWVSAFAVPDDFIKLRRLRTTDGSSIDKFDFRRANHTRCILAGDYTSIVLEYVQLIDDPTTYDPLFLQAFITLLASRLARAISGNEKLEGELLAAYQQLALTEARTADAHDSQSNENHPLKDFLAGNLLGTRGDYFPEDYP